MATKMAVSQPGHFGSRGKLLKSEQTYLARRHTWQEDPPKISSHVTRTAMSAE